MTVVHSGHQDAHPRRGPVRDLLGPHLDPERPDGVRWRNDTQLQLPEAPPDDVPPALVHEQLRQPSGLRLHVQELSEQLQGRPSGLPTAQPVPVCGAWYDETQPYQDNQRQHRQVHLCHVTSALSSGQRAVHSLVKHHQFVRTAPEAWSCRWWEGVY